ncbi:hypothetical protein [Streptococcus cristatus]|uniref:hypothetical protein n=1 Tax=Streptococcus cristatus TaxID=45634 RepID=UPI001652F8EF|nr:hypothetical protein [Streptococcus cristatus]
MMDVQILFILLISSVVSLISFIVVAIASDRSSKKMRDEMYKGLWENHEKKK